MVSKESYEAYTAFLDKAYAEMSQLLSDYINSFNWNVAYEAAKAQRDAVALFCNELVDIYGNVTARLAADFYREQAILNSVSIAEPLIADMPAFRQIATAVRYAARSLWGGVRDAESFRADCLASMKRYIKKAANDTMILNAQRDGMAGKGIRWARVPRGNETCAFCIMLASRGFVYYSEQSAELFSHEHKNCDCDVICSFSDGGLEGYSEREYEEIYYAAQAFDEYGHVYNKETLNNIRRSFYDDYKDRWNAMRRERYKRQHLQIEEQ